MSWFACLGKKPQVRTKTAPHRIPEGMENAVCPVTGLSAGTKEVNQQQLQRDATDAKAALDADPDIEQERLVLVKRTSGAAALQPAATSLQQLSAKFVPLRVIRGSHQAAAETVNLFREAGGLPAVRRFTNLFYEKSFADPHIDKFIRSHDDPHGERFALWIAEKMGDGTPWTDERATRPVTLLRVGQHVEEVSYDRSSAHFAAWFSPKREPQKRGTKFQPEDARVWMRLHFWAAREAGLFEHEAFMDYYIRFIGHFVSVYSSRSPPFTRESARWSADPKNIERYLASGNRMTDVIGVDLDKALAALPVHERVYTGSKASSPSWPYAVK